MRKMSPCAILVAVMILLPVLSVGEEPNYKFVEGGGIDIDPDGSLGSQDGWFAGGSFGMKHFQVFAEYQNVSDITQWFVGAGWHGLLGEKADVVAEASYVDVEVDTGLGKISEDGYRLTGGVRWQLLKWFELNGFANYTDLDNSSSDTSVEANVIFTIAFLGLGAGYEVGDADVARVFIRFNF